MRITYVLDAPEMNGGHKVVFQHVRLLRGMGCEVTVLGQGPRPAWAGFDGPYHDLSAGPPRLGSQDLVIATFWTTIPVARRLGAGPVAHFCQGYEGGLAHLAADLPRIEEVYSWPVPALVVSPHLGELLFRRFGRPSRVAPPPLDPLFRPTRRPRLGPRRRPWIAVPGIFEAEVKGVPTALEAVRRLRGRGLAARVLRFTFLPLSAGERELLEPDRYLCGVAPGEIARALRGCDLLFFSSRAEEGFGLPLLEAMASEVPAVASRIPSTVDFAEGAVALALPGDAEAFAEHAWWLLTEAPAWRRARELGARAARRFAPEAVAPLLLAGVRWAAAQGTIQPSTST
jgi:glycosyltransferase involved in cell wall biosynthesis